ncbi:MAG: polyprenyl synthetase family protein [Bacteroidales bacterium]|nr:polyprenyl synthetase family protein [Bacteroidales bacterium]
MASVDIIKSPIKNELKEFNSYFQNYMKGGSRLLNLVTQYILKRKGKQMRPMLVFLSAKMLGEINSSTYAAAALIELMHTATLLHDDVVDDAYQRRSFFSINALWKNKIAILMGDFLLARGLLLAVNNNEHELLKIVSVSVEQMSEGELLQIEKSRKLDITEKVYFEIIGKKTASLISACAESGASSGSASNECIVAMREFGKNLGIAFQIKDDLFDFQKVNNSGKPSGNDIQERKMTLPLIYALNVASEKERKSILRIVKRHNSNPKKVDEVVQFVHKNGGIDYATSVMESYKQKALDILEKFPENEAKNSLRELVLYTTKRKK